MYESVQESYLYAILMILMKFIDPLNIVMGSHYVERFVLHMGNPSIFTSW